MAKIIDIWINVPLSTLLASEGMTTCSNAGTELVWLLEEIVLGWFDANFSANEGGQKLVNIF